MMSDGEGACCLRKLRGMAAIRRLPEGARKLISDLCLQRMPLANADKPILVAWRYRLLTHICSAFNAT
jgi:hypothetical protein